VSSPRAAHTAVGHHTSDLFWTPDTGFGIEYGDFHQAAKNAPEFVPGLLLVFVHGINSNPVTCWGDLPQQLLLELAADLDVLNFRFPSTFLQRTSIPSAAEALNTVLRTGVGPTYEDIIFVTHSTGGLVVKQLLIDDDRAGRNIVHRTRQIVNFGVPHAGSLPGISELLRKLVVGSEIALLPIAKLVRFASLGKLNLGRNRIYSQLKHNCAFIRELETRYLKVMSEHDYQNIARPESIEITADSDVVSQGRDTRPERVYEANSDRDNLVVRGTHSSMKFSEISIRMLKEHLAVPRIWKNRKSQFDSAIAHGSIYRIALIEQSTGVEKLFREDSKVQPSERNGCDQAACFVRLRDIVHERAPGVRRVVVRGAMGVGKSVVLRRLCWTESQRFVEASGSERQILILFFPIDRMSLEPDLTKFDGKVLWKQLCLKWIDSAIDLLAAATIPAPKPRFISHSWLQQRIRDEESVLILDGVDEFLANHPNVRIQDFQDAIATASSECLEGKLTVILGIRETLLGIEALLAGGDSEDLQILPLTVETATELLPGLAGKIEALEPSDRQAVLSPLVLTALCKTSRLPTKTSAATIMQEAMESLIDWNRISEKIHGLAPLSLIGWIYYKKFQRELTLEGIARLSDELLQRWERHLDLCRSRTNAMSVHLEECVKSFRSIVISENMRFILERSFFFPTAANAFSFSHEAWRDYLVTIYLSLCIRHGNVGELGQVAFRVDHHERAGELLADFQVEEDLIEAVISETHVRQDRFIAGNFVGLLGISKIPMSTAAARAIVRGCVEFEPLARFVALGRLGGRSLRLGHGDKAVPDLRAALVEVLPEVMSREDCNSITRSLCYCYSRAIGANTQGDYDRPMLILEDALDWVRDKTNAGAEPSDEYRSLQMSFLYSQFTVTRHLERAVMTAHYLYLITAARIKSCAISEVCEHLPHLLKKGSDLDQFFASYTNMPELHHIYLECQTMWNKFSGANDGLLEDGYE
jgi:hypothetical protein